MALRRREAGGAQVLRITSPCQAPLRLLGDTPRVALGPHRHEGREGGTGAQHHGPDPPALPQAVVQQPLGEVGLPGARRST